MERSISTLTEIGLKAGTVNGSADTSQEEVLYVILAQCVCDTGLTADPENILQLHGGRGSNL
jgi:hypothetical protein